MDRAFEETFHLKWRSW